MWPVLDKKLPASQQIYEKKSIVTESASNLLKSTGLFDDEEEDVIVFFLNIILLFNYL